MPKKIFWQICDFQCFSKEKSYFSVQELLRTMDNKFFKENMYPHAPPCFKKNTLLIKKNNSSDNLINSDGPDSFQQRKLNAGIPWFPYVVYLHIIVLYFLLFSLYNDLRKTKETMNEFHMNIIDITMKGLEVEKNCLFEINNLKKSLKENSSKRIRREIISDSYDFERSPIDINRSDVSKANFSNISESDIPHDRSPRRVSNDRRGKKKHKRKNKRRRGHAFPVASHFIGAYPEPHIKDGGILAPWLVDKDAIKEFNLVTKVPSRGREAVEVINNGLYFIYAQVYYITPKSDVREHNSFSIMLKTSSGFEVPLAQCATLGDSTVGGDASCFTATAYSLNSGDLIYIKQRERDRNIVMKPGQTFLGLVLLNKK